MIEVKRINSGCRLVCLAAFLVLLVAGCSSVDPDPVTDDFKIEINTYSTEWRPSQFLEIRSNGKCKYFIIPPGMDKKPVRKNFELSRGRIKRIRRKIEKVGFFNLEPEYINDRFPTGWHVVMTVDDNGRHHSVHTMETEIQPIIQIMELINRYTPLPPHMKFLNYEMY